MNPFARLLLLHRALWRTDPSYRWAALGGPPPLLGALVAVLVLAVLHRADLPAGIRAPWATSQRTAAEDRVAFAEPPDGPLPPPGTPDGWRGAFQPVTIDATDDVDVHPERFGGFTVSGPTLPVGRLLAAAPPTGGLSVPVASTGIAIHAEGEYGISARLSRAGNGPADCMVRLGTRHRRLLSELTLGMAPDATRTYPVAILRLRPGLLFLVAGAACWRDGRAADPGTLTLLLRHPGDPVPEPLRPDELVQPPP